MGKANKHLYLLTRARVSGLYYDTYDSAVVCAMSSDDARNIHPDGGQVPLYERKDSYDDSWVSFNEVRVKYLGDAEDTLPVGVIVASYNAG